MYINESLGLYPRFDGDIQLINPSWQPGMPLPEGWEEVYHTEPPQPAVGECTEQLYPEKIDGVWYIKWNIRKKTEEEIEQEIILKEETKKRVIGTIKN